MRVLDRQKTAILHARARAFQSRERLSMNQKVLRKYFSASLFLCGLIFFAGTSTAQTRDLTRWVNPFIGTGGHGHTFPGATMPFGMVQLSPDTRIDNWDGSSGYHYSDDIIYGFSHTHLSGTGIPDGCDILFMPTVGEPQFEEKRTTRSSTRFASKFSSCQRKGRPGILLGNLDNQDLCRTDGDRSRSEFIATHFRRRAKQVSL